MAIDVGNLGASFLSAFTTARQAREDREDRKKERDARLKLFELQMKREQAAATQAEQAAQARAELFAQLTPQQIPNPTPPLIRAPDAPDTVPGRTPSLTELLADPKSAMLFLQSGLLKPEDLLTQQNNQANRALLQQVMGGGGVGGGMELQGVKIGPGGQLMPDFGLPQVTSPQTVDTPEGPRLRTYNPRTGNMVADLGAPKPDNVAPEVAGRISGLVQAQQIGDNVRSQLIKPDGSIDRTLVLTSFAKAPGSKGRSLRNDMQIAIDAVLRARTGAGVNAEEMKQVVDQFLPSPLDSDAGILNKMERFDQFVNGALDVATLPPSVRKKLKDSGSSPATGSSNVIDFSQLPK